MKVFGQQKASTNRLRNCVFVCRFVAISEYLLWSFATIRRLHHAMRQQV